MSRRNLDNSDYQAKLAHICKSAMSRGLRCTLTLDNVKLIMEEQYCCYTGEKFTRHGDNHRTFERVNNDLGYIPGNVIPVTQFSNNEKKSFTKKEMRENIQTIIVRAETLEVQYNNGVKNLENKKLVVKNYSSKKNTKNFSFTELMAMKNRIKNMETANTQMLNRIKELVKRADVLEKIVNRLDTDGDMGYKYMTKWQRFRSKIFKYR